MSDDRAKVARRISGALGRKVDPAEIEILTDTAVFLTAEDQLVSLAARGNVAYVGGGVWMRNGAVLSDAEVDRLSW
jgi:hypothetical protein